MKLVVYLTGVLLIVYNLHAGLTAQKIGLFGLDIEFSKIGDAIHAEPLGASPAIVRSDENRALVNPTVAPAAPTSVAVRATVAPKPTTVPTARPSDQCVQGFVWREAVAGDHVCVSQQTRAQAQTDNQQGAARKSPTGGPFGPDTCLPGFVWREATPNDHVCVTPQARDTTAADNRQAQSRIQR